MPGAKRKKKQTISKDSVTIEFFESGMGATSSPTGNKLSDPLSDILTVIKEESKLQKDFLIREVNDYKQLLAQRFELIRMEFGPTALKITDYYTKGYIKASSSQKIEDKDSLGIHDSQINKKEKDETKTARQGRTRRSSSVPPIVQGKEKGGIDADGFRIPNNLGRELLRRGSMEQLCTPSNSRQPRGYRNIALVTPGPNVDAPLSVLRRPFVGETAISLSGSPLLVTTDVSTANFANLSVPLDKNKVISIFPRDGFDVKEMPQIDENTKNQLFTLKEYLGAILEHC